MAKVMIVDDNRNNLSLMRDFVESWGYEIVTAQQGTEAITLALQEKPDAILLDVMLPGMSGYEVCKELKETESTKNIPITLVTALMDSEDRLHGLKMGADYFLTKPLPYSELKVVLENQIRIKNRFENQETRLVVAKTIVKLLALVPSLTPSPNREKLLDYANRMVRLCHLDQMEAELLLISTELYAVGLLDNKEICHRVIEATSGLSIASRINDILKAMEAFKNQKDLSLGEEKDDKAFKALAALSGFFELQEQVKDEEQALNILKGKGCYELKALQALETVVKDSKMLDFLK